MLTDAYDYQRSALRSGVVQDNPNYMNETYSILGRMREQGVAFKETANGIAWSILDAFFGRSRKCLPGVVTTEHLRLQFFSVEEYYAMASLNRLEFISDRAYAVATANPQLMVTHGRRISLLRFEHTRGVRVPPRGFAIVAFNLGSGQWGYRPYGYQLSGGQRVLKIALTEQSHWEDYMAAGRPISLLEIMIQDGQSALDLTLGDVYAATIVEPTPNVVAFAQASLEAVHAGDAIEEVQPAACPGDKSKVQPVQCPQKLSSVVARQLAKVVGERLAAATGNDVVGAVSATGSALPIQVFGSEDTAAEEASWPGLGYLARQTAIAKYYRENYAAIDARAKQIALRRSGAAASGEVKAAGCPSCGGDKMVCTLSKPGAAPSPCAARKPLPPVPVAVVKARAPVGGGAFHIEAMLELARESVGLPAASPLGDALFEVYLRTYGPDLATAISAMPTFHQLLDQISGLPSCFDRTPAEQLEELLTAEIDDLRTASAPRDKLDRYAANLMRDSTPLARGGALFAPSGVADFVLALCVPKLYERTNDVLTGVLGMSKRSFLSGFPVGGALADSHTQSDIRGLQMTVMASVYDAAAAARAINASMTEKDGSVDLRRVVLATHVFNWRAAESLIDRYETNPGQTTMIPLRSESERLAIFMTASPTVQGVIGARPTLFPASADEKDAKKYVSHASVDPQTMITLKYMVSGVSNGGNTLVAADPFSGVVVVARTSRRIPAMETPGSRDGVLLDVFGEIYKALQMHDSPRRSPLALYELIKAAGQARAVSAAFLEPMPTRSQAEVTNARSDERRGNLGRIVAQVAGKDLVLLAGSDGSDRTALRIAAVPDKPDVLNVTIVEADGSSSEVQAKFDPRFGRAGGEFRVQRRVDDEEPAAPLRMQVVPSFKLSNGEKLTDVVLVSFWCHLYTLPAAASELIKEQARRLKSEESGEPTPDIAPAAGAEDEYYPLAAVKPLSDPTLFAANGTWGRIKASAAELAGPSHGDGALLHPWAETMTRPGQHVYGAFSKWH